LTKQIIPTGPREHRDRVIESRRFGLDNSPIPSNIRIAKQGEPIRALGTFVGNNIENVTVWIPTVERVREQLEKWNRRANSQIRRRLIVNMTIGEITQYHTVVQGMPIDMEKRLTKMINEFMWNGPPRVGLDTIREPTKIGGLKLLDIKARNEVIDLMRLKNYLNLGQERARWTYLADTLIAKSIPNSQHIKDKRVAINKFLQTWKASTRQVERVSLPFLIK
jgi:hypothetical protein